jgi:hypothetical protein
VHGAVFTITKEVSEEYNLLAFDNLSREPVEEEIKQGTGDLRACGPSTFTSVDSFIKFGEPVPVRDPLCAAININANTNAVNIIDQTEIIENKENVHANANEKKSVEFEIDLKKEMIERAQQSSLLQRSIILLLMRSRSIP